jgi:hypothetical protein
MKNQAKEAFEWKGGEKEGGTPPRPKHQRIRKK